MSPSEYDHDPELRRPRGGHRWGDARRIDGPARWLAVGVAIALVMGSVIAYALTQTQRGREEVLAYTLTTLGGRLNGRLTAERLDGNLLAGARLYEVALADTAGVPLLIADSVYIRYRAATFTGGDIVITRLDVYGSRIDIYRMPGDTIWNYQEILQDPTPDAGGDPNATLVEQLRLYDSHVRIRAPLEPDPRYPPERQQEEIRAILADTARWMLEETPTGYLRVASIEIEEGELAELIVGPDERGGIYFEIVRGIAEARMWQRAPLSIRDVQGQFNLRDGVFNFQVPRAVLSDSRAEIVGRIDLTGDRPLYDLVITTPQFTFSDLRWLYPWMPDDPAAGGGALRLWVEDRPDGLLVLARNLDVEMPGTHITGRFGLIADDGLRFVDVQLEAEPLLIDSVERLLPQDLPVEGLVIGGATIRGES